MHAVWYHTRIKHDDIIAMWAAWLESDHICMALEYAPRGSIFMLLRRDPGMLTEAFIARTAILPVLRALLLMHQLGLIHRDVSALLLARVTAAAALSVTQSGLRLNH